MGEEILKIGIGELTTIRIIDDGVVTEMPISKIEEHFGPSHHPLAASLRQLAKALQSLAEKPSGMETEFVIPVKR